MKETITRNPFLLASELSNSLVISRDTKCSNSVSSKQKKKQWGAAILSKRKKIPMEWLSSHIPKQVLSNCEPHKTQLTLTFQVGPWFDLQLDALNSCLFTYNTIIKLLYMFRA
jgi:hypothetical protein